MKRDDTPKIFDVSRPSRSNPDNTSRPIIVGHRPEMVDPMVHRPSKPPKVDDTPAPPAVTSTTSTHHSMLSAQSADTGAASIPEHHQAKIISVSEEIKNNLAVAEQTPAQPQPETPPPPAPEPPAPEPTQTSQPEEESPAPPPAEPAASPEVPMPAEPASQSSKVVSQSNDAVTSTTAQQPASAEVHHQSLPLGHAPMTSTRRLKHMLLWLFVIVFLALFLGYLAIDSGFISTNIKLPFHIFGGQA